MRAYRKLRCAACLGDIRLKVNVKERLVFRGRDFVRLTPTQFKLFLFLYYNGEQSTHALMDFMYGDDENGGPEMGVNHLNVLFAQANLKLDHIRAAIGSRRHNYRELLDVAGQAT